MRRKTEGLTKKQKEVLDFIKKFHAENKYPPSIRQICSAIDLSSPATVHVHVNHLVEKGYIKRSAEGNRAMELLVPNEYENVGKEVVSVPLLIKENIEDPIKELEMPKALLDIPTYLIPKKKEVFTLKEYDNVDKIKKLYDDKVTVSIYYIDNTLSNDKQGEYDKELMNSNNMDDVRDVVNNILELYRENNNIKLING